MHFVRTLPLAIAALIYAGTAGANATAHVLASGDYTQDWTNTGLITTNDDWSGVPAVLGYRGDEVTTTVGGDPQTLLGEGTVVLDVNANQTNPVSFTTGGVTEFELADPTVALAGSGTADAPSLLINLDTSGRYNVLVEYNVRDLDGSADNAVQPVALQYRVGSTGNFTNIAAAFVADATTANAATLVTPVSVTLPAAADNQPLVQIRMITVNATGNDEPVGIDDIFISGGLPPPPAVSIGNVSVTEGNPPGTTTMNFTATLSTAIPDSCDFRVETFDSSPAATATAGVDYTSTDVAVSIPANQLTASFSVPILRDADTEPDEILVVSAYGEPFECDISAAEAQGTIIDDDGVLPVATISDVSLNEGNAGTTNATLTVSLDAPAPANGVLIGYASADGSATAGSDYTAVNAALLIPVGQQTGTIDVPVLGDTSVEGDETFVVNLSAPANATLGDAQALVTILNDDVPLTGISVADGSTFEGTGAGSTSLSFVVTLSAPPAVGQPITVSYATANGTASGSDYTASSGTLNFVNGGALTQTISVPVTRDAIDEDDEALTLDLTSPVNGQITDAQATGTIVDDDAAPTPSVSNITVSEGNAGTVSAQFTITLSNPSSFPVGFQAFTSDGSAASTSDYAAVPVAPATQISFPPLTTSQTINVTVNGDTLVEAPETFNLNLAGGDPLRGLPTVIASGTATIVNDDSATLSITGSSVPEGNIGNSPVGFVLTLSNPVQGDVQVNYASADGSATLADSDYQAASGTLTIPGQTLTANLTVNGLGDTEVEPDQSFAVNLSGLVAPAGVTLASSSANGTLTNDDSTLFNISDTSVVEGTGGSSALVFTVSLTAPAKDPVSVQYATADVSAVAGVDYTATSGTLTFSGGQLSRTINVSVNTDSLVEADESLRVNLSNPVGATINTGAALGSIINDDAAALSITDLTQAEGNGSGTTPFVFTISTSNPSATPITVSYATSDISATAPSDYASTSGTLTIPALASSTTLTINVVADDVLEPSEDFRITLSAPVGATLADAVGIGTILGDEQSVPVPALQAPALIALILTLLAAAGWARRRL